MPKLPTNVSSPNCQFFSPLLRSNNELGRTAMLGKILIRIKCSFEGCFPDAAGVGKIVYVTLASSLQ
jgi:hypothetical protein